jgi:hypothetical protein
MNKVPRTESVGIDSIAVKIATAMARSKLDPDLGTEAGDKLTVIFRAGNGNPLLLQADRTLEVASDSEASGSPTSTNAGRLALMSAST